MNSISSSYSSYSNDFLLYTLCQYGNTFRNFVFKMSYVLGPVPQYIIHKKRRLLLYTDIIPLVLNMWKCAFGIDRTPNQVTKGDLVTLLPPHKWMISSSSAVLIPAYFLGLVHPNFLNI